MALSKKTAYALKKLISLFMAWAFLFSSTPAWSLAPKLALTQDEFCDEYFTCSIFLTEASVRQYIELNKRYPGLYRIDKDTAVCGVKGLLKNTGQIAKIDFDLEGNRPIIYVDTNYFYNETVIGFEKEKIAALEALRRNKGYSYLQMIEWLEKYADTKDPSIGNKTSREWADGINGIAQSKHPGIVRLYDRIKAKYGKALWLRQTGRAESLLNFASMYEYYKRAGYILDRDDKHHINLAAHINPVTPVDKHLMKAIAQKQRRKNTAKSFIEENAAVLKGKSILSLSMEGNIPEFAGLSMPAQDANTKGGLGAYYGDKFDGFDELGLNGIGCQPGYSYYRDTRTNTDTKVDYDQLVREGVLEEVAFDEPISVWNGLDDPVIGDIVNNRDIDERHRRLYGDWIVARHGENIRFKVKVYKIKRRGRSNRYLFVSPIFDYLYPDDNTNGKGNGRIHRFCQEVAFGKAVYEFCLKKGLSPDILHLNEGHTVVAAAEMRKDPKFNNMAIVYTNHTLVQSGLEKFMTTDVMDKVFTECPNKEEVDANATISRLIYLMGSGSKVHESKFIYQALNDDGTPVKDEHNHDVYVVDFSTAAIELADVVTAVSDEHAIATKKMFDEIFRKKKELFTVDVVPILNGSGKSWVMDDILAFQDKGRDPDSNELCKIHEKTKREAYEEIFKRTKVRLDPAKPTAWLIRRLVDYKKQYPILKFIIHLMVADRSREFTRQELRQIWFRDITNFTYDYWSNNFGTYDTAEAILDVIFGKEGETVKKVNGLGMQVVVGWPLPAYEKFWAEEFHKWMRLNDLKGRFVAVESDSKMLKMQAVGSDICINMPQPLKEACGTSDQRSGLNGGVNIAIRGAGPVEWITDYEKKEGKKMPDGSGFLIGSYTDEDQFGNKWENLDKFHKYAPTDIFARCAQASEIFYNDKREWRRIMHNSYMASTHGRYIDKEGEPVITRAVTATAMEMRYAKNAYVSAIRKKQYAKIDALTALKNNDGLIKQALDKSTGTLNNGEFDILKEIGIFVAVDGKPNNYRFSDMMIGEDIDYTKTLLNGVIDQFKSCPVTDTETAKEIVKMAVIHEINKEIAAPADRVLWHIIEHDVVPVQQRSTIVTQTNKAFRDNEKLTEKTWVLDGRKSISDAIAEIRIKNPDALIDVALTSEEHISLVPDDKEIKMLVFQSKDFIQLEGVIAALKALHSENPLPILLRIYSVMAGEPYKNPPQTVSDNPKEFARKLIFDLPRAVSVPVDDIPKLNERLLVCLIAA